MRKKTCDHDDCTRRVMVAKYHKDASDGYLVLKEVRRTEGEESPETESKIFCSGGCLKSYVEMKQEEE